jgi:Zn-dependent protease with chaperone function
MADEKKNGRLFIDTISDETINRRVFGFLRKVFPRIGEKTIAALLTNPKSYLALSISLSNAEKLIGRLKTLGAGAKFTPESDLRATPPESEPINCNQIKSQVFLSFKGKNKPITKPFSYYLGLALISVLMMLLPLVYVLLIIGTAYLVILHIHSNLSLFQSNNSPHLALFVYVSPIIIGSIVLLFMVKPLFARHGSFDTRTLLEPDKEPFIYMYVRKIAETLGAPIPSNIYTIMEVNASANLEPGISSIFTNKLELTIGLPLIAGMNLHQLTEVVGHELGHFSQSTGMRLSIIIRNINLWFARVVYEKDAWDTRIITWSREWDFRFALLLYVAKLFIWLNRKLLWGLMWIGEAVSCYMMRQMEFDADRHGLSLVGANWFQNSSERLEILSWAYTMANDDLGNAWQEGRLADNLPELIKERAGRVTPDQKQELINAIRKSEQKALFNTHPSTAERIAQAHRYDNPPLFYLDLDNHHLEKYNKAARASDASGVYRNSIPSGILLKDLSAFCKSETHYHYETLLEQSISNDRLIAVDELLNAREKESAAVNSLEKIFLGQFNLLRKPLMIDAIAEAPQNPESFIADITKLRGSLEKMKNEYMAASQVASKIDNRLLLLDQAEALLGAGFNFDPKEFNIVRSDIVTVEQSRSRARSEQETQFDIMEKFERTAFEIMGKSLSQLNSAFIRNNLPDSVDLRQKAVDYIETWNNLSRAHADFVSIESVYHQLILLAHQMEDNQENELFISSMFQLMHEGHHKLQDLKKRFANIEYPFNHADGKIYLGHFLVGLVPAEDQLGPLIDALERGMKSPYELLHRLASAMAAIVVKVEEIYNMN